MKGAIVILLFTVLVGVVLYVFELRHRRRHGYAPLPDDKTPDGSAAGESGEAPLVEDTSGHAGSSEAEECCGLHLVCEKDSLSPMSGEIIYYDDEELDRFIGRAPDSYSAEEVEEFRDILMTLRPDDVAGWARSITQRHIELPGDVRDELLLLVNEQRQKSH